VIRINILLNTTNDYNNHNQNNKNNQIKEISRKEKFKKIYSLKQVESLEDIAILGGFFCDLGYNHKDIVPIYPQRNTHFSHDSIKLYGVNFRYLLDLDTNQLIKDETKGVYAFTKRYLDTKESLFIFKPKTLGWNYYKQILIPQYKRDKESE